MRSTQSLVLLAVLASGVAHAQETGGHVTGRVVSSSRGPVVGARVTADGPNMQGARTAVSDRDGVFQLLTLPPGKYSFRIVAMGHQSLVVRDALVQLGRTTGLGELRLQSIAVALGEVTVRRRR